MLRISALFALVALLWSSAQAETIVADNLGNVVSLPLVGGLGAAQLTNRNSLISTSPYILNVFVNNGEDNGQSATPPPFVGGTIESFFFEEPANGLYGNATLVNSGYSRTFSTANLTQAIPVGQFLGSPDRRTNETGLYQFVFNIPVLSSVLTNITYVNEGNPFPLRHLISILVTNPAVVVGDPQFIGLRGQTYQVHGIDGAVYNIISEHSTQVNARFVFLESGECPIINGVAESNCWSHAGSYLGQMGFQQVVDGKLHQALLTAGPASQGFAGVTLDGRSIAVGSSISFGSFSITVKSSHHVSIKQNPFHSSSRTQTTSSIRHYRAV